jgi:hypothetical protein
VQESLNEDRDDVQVLGPHSHTDRDGAGAKSRCRVQGKRMSCTGMTLPGLVEGAWRSVECYPDASDCISYGPVLSDGSS